MAPAIQAQRGIVPDFLLFLPLDEWVPVVCAEVDAGFDADCGADWLGFGNRPLAGLGADELAGLFLPKEPKSNAGAPDEGFAEAGFGPGLAAGLAADEAACEADG